MDRNPSLSGISSLRSDIPPRLRRGVAKHKEKWRSSKTCRHFSLCFAEREVLNLCLSISFTSMSYISSSTNLVANCDIQVDGTKVADIFDLPKFEAKKMTLEEKKGISRGFLLSQKLPFV